MDPITWVLDFFNTFLSLGLLWIIVIIVVAFLVLMLIQAFFLYLAIKMVDAKNDNFGAVFVTALINSFLLPIPCLGCILAWVVIDSRHDTGFGKAILVWLLSGLIGIAITVGVVFGLIFLITVFF